MADSSSVSETQEVVPAARNRFLALGAAVLVVVAIISLTVWQQPTAENQGIVYPINGQTITGDGVTIYSTFELNTGAVAEALLKNGKKAELQSIEPIGGYGTSHYQYLIHLPLVDGDKLSLQSDIYNQQKDSQSPAPSPVPSVPFAPPPINPDGTPSSSIVPPPSVVYPPLPHDLAWVYSKNSLFIDRVQETDNSEETKLEFEAFISGSDKPQDLIVFSLGLPLDKKTSAIEGNNQYLIDNCRNSSSLLQQGNGELDWNQFKIRSFTVSKKTAQSVVFSLPDTELKDDACLFVALKNDASSVQSFLPTYHVDPHATLSLEQLFNPDLDFKSQILIHFDTPFLDFRKKRTPDDELAYRLSYKKKLASLITISPAAEIIPEDITLYADHAEVPVRFTEKKHYQFTLNAGQDVFGATFAAQTLEQDTGELKYLGLRQKETQSVFMSTMPPTIEVVHAGVDNPTVKICSIGSEEYAKIELIASRKSLIKDSDAFLKAGLDNLPVKKCQEQLIELKKDGYRTPVDMAKLIHQPADLGLYYMTFSFQGERQVSPQAPISVPLFFAIVDSHITMKFSKNGKALFWVNDLSTGKGVAGVTLTGYQNTFTASEGHYDEASQRYVDTYFNPLEKPIYSTPIKLGKTDADGFLEVDLSADDYVNAFDSWYADPEYRSLLVNASGDNHFSTVVSKWNSGIADWNFGYNPESYDPAGNFSGHLYPDRKLYEPGETVHLKAIVREQGKQLIVPAGKSFDLTVTDSNGGSILEKSVTLNDFGSVLEDLTIKDDAPLGEYLVDIKTNADQGSEYIATTSFNVEQFQKPTFKVDVTVNSPDLQNDQFVSPTITETNTGWGYRYKSYEKNLNLAATVDAGYYAGGKVSNAAFTYTVFKQYYYEPTFWSDCYYGCYYEPSKDYYSEGSGQLDGDGKATVTIPVLHQTSWDDYRYIVEFAVTDPSSQKVAGSGSVIVKIPDSLRQSNPNVDIQLDVDKHFVQAGDSVNLTIRPERKWSTANDGRYQLTLKHREYTSKNEKQVGGNVVPQVDFEDKEVDKVIISSTNFTVNTDGTLSKSIPLPQDGDYTLELTETDPSASNSIISNLSLYAYAKEGVTNAPVVADNKITVLAEKTSYHLGEKAQILVRFPFTDGKALITIEKKNVVSKELIDFTGNVLRKEYLVDDTFVPNAYISIIAFKPAGDTKIQPEYKVGYTEIVVDKADKKLNLDLKTNADTYSPRDKVTLDITATDINKKPVESEVSVAVVDESLISILGNIDLDILPKFFTKIVFQTQTALTNVAMMQQLYFARKGTVGGSGGKDGGDAIVTRTNFKNTAFYAGSVVTDANGKAQLTFDLPDNIGEFRIITIGDSKTNSFGAAEKTISVHQEVTVEDTFPMIVRSGDDMQVGATVYNNSPDPKNIFVSLDADGLTLPDNQRQKVEIKAGERQFVTWKVGVKPGADTSKITYTITASDEKTQKGDRLEKTVPFASVPLLANRLHLQDDFQTTTDHHLKTLADIDPSQSFVELSFSGTILAGIEKIISSLLEYPYGCIEQTISSTLPNAIVKKFQSLMDIGIDEKTLQKNLDAGVKRFASMQTDDGGFAFWQGEKASDPRITPYAVEAIVLMRDLGVAIPADMLDRAKVYLETQVNALQGTIPNDQLSQLVHEASALAGLNSEAFTNARTLIKNRVKDLTTHEKIVYGLALAKKDIKNYHDEIADLVKSIDTDKSDNNRDWTIDWYWDGTSNKAMFTQLLIRFDPQDARIVKNIKELYGMDLGDYYYSTQSKIQSFLAFADYIEKSDSPNKSLINIDYQLGKKSGKVTLDARHIFQKITLPFADLQGTGGDLSFKATVNGTTDHRVYTDLLVYQIPKDPTTVKAQQDKGVTVTRQYFKLGKVKETDNNWWSQKERDLAAVSGNTFKLGETYLVKLTMHFNDAQHQVALESYLPAGLKLINTAFLTEQTQVGADRWDWPFDHQEFRDDRFFASAHEFYSSNYDFTINYYVRANIAGDFLEPPVSVYPMYRPEVEGHTEFRKITVEE